ncbi:MAG TPA: hypothetical protein V6D19_06365 [Stenomitos sp.]
MSFKLMPILSRVLVWLLRSVASGDAWSSVLGEIGIEDSAIAR